MPIARSMKELEKMLINECKRRLENIMKNYSDSWYERHEDMSQFLSKNEFWGLVKKSSKIEVVQSKKEIIVKFMIVDITYPSELDGTNKDAFNGLWNAFLEEYEPYMKQQKIEM